MNHKRAVLFLILISCIVGLAGQAQTSNEVTQAAPKRTAPRVGMIGDLVPPITVAEWIKGKPVKLPTGTNSVGTNIYVLVFCTLTRANDFALTNLNNLQKLYGNKGVITVAISDESPDQLKTFVMAKGGDMDFTVAADDVPGRTAKTYLQVFGQRGLPRAFVVGADRKLLWHGHPLTDGLGQVVDDLVSGRFDLAATQKKVFARQQMEIYVYLARQNDPKAEQIGKLLFRYRTNDAPALVEMASKIATDAQIDHRDVVLANAALERAAELSSTNNTDISLVRAFLLFQSGKEAEALARAKEILAAAQTEAAREEVQTSIRAMEVRIAMAKTNQMASPTGTNGTSSPAPKP